MRFDNLFKRANQFAKDCIKLCEKLPRTPLGKHIEGQLIIASTSVASNYRISCRTNNKKSFLVALSIVIEETNETEYWLGLIKEENLINEKELDSLINESKELASFFIKSKKTILKNLVPSNISKDIDEYKNSIIFSHTSKNKYNRNKTSSINNSKNLNFFNNNSIETIHSVGKNIQFIPFVDLKAQYKTIETEILEKIKKVFNKTKFINGEEVEQFENNFAKLIGTKHCIGLGNGTDALIIALKTVGINPGDEVITVANTFIATSEAISAIGAKVVFVDINPRTYNIDITKIKEKITKNTKAIIPVHLYGQIADMNAILSIAKKYNLKVIEDSSQAHLSEYKSLFGNFKKAGTFGDIATFSFYPGKNLGAYGDAGAIVTDNNDLAKKAKMYANHGRITKYSHEFEGYNSRLDELQAAILNVKLKYISAWTEKRRNIAKYYSKLLKDFKGVSIPSVDYEQYNPAWHLYVIKTEQRDELKNYLKTNGISTGVHYPIALPNLKAYKYLKHKPNDFPIASEFQDKILSLPIYPEISKKQIDYVVENIKNFFKSKMSNVEYKMLLDKKSLIEMNKFYKHKPEKN